MIVCCRTDGKRKMDSLEQELCIAILEKNHIVVNELLRQGANINKCYKKRTPLGIAAKVGDISILKILLSHVENEEVPTEENNYVQVKKRCLERNEKSTNANANCSSNLNNSTDSNNLGYYIVVHNDYADINNGTEERTPEGMERLEWDVEIKDNEEENENNENDSWGSLFRWYASILDKTADMLQVPIKSDVNHVDEYGRIALHYAIDENNVEATKLLLAAGSQVQITDSNGNSSLHLACANKTTDIVKILIENGARVNVKNNNRKEPLHVAAATDNVSAVHLLIAAGARIDEQDLCDRTPLALAVLCNAENSVRALIDYGAKVNLEDSQGNTPLCTAVWQQSINIVRLLLKAGAKITHSHYLLHFALFSEDIEIARLLLEAGSTPNIMDTSGTSAFIVAVRTGNVNLVQLLLDHGAFINQLSACGSNCIHEAVVHIEDVSKFKEMYNLLHEYGADVNLNSCLISGLTPLSRALFYERIETAAILIRYGADVNSYDKLLNEYNLCVARRKKYFYIVKLLVYAGANIRNSTADLKHLSDASYDTDTIDGWLSYMKYNPLSLADQCRIFFRKRYGTSVYRTVNNLPLPKPVKSFLVLEDMTEFRF